MLTEKDIVRIEIKTSTKGIKYKYEVYNCKGCNKEMLKTSFSAKKATGFCIKCSRNNRVKIDRNITGKKCNYCNRTLSIDNFFKQSNKSYYTSSCKECINIKKYNITYEEYYNLLIKQNYNCAICNKPEVTGKSLAIDHCHNTGKVRGLLCYRCNTTLGKVEEDKNLLLNMIKYLNED